MHKLIGILIAVSACWGCSSSTYQAPIVDAAKPPQRTVTAHIVSPGDTLYSIAWRYDLDYKKLSKINGLDSQYRIWPGQKLILTGASARDDSRSSNVLSSASKSSNSGLSKNNNKSSKKRSSSKEVAAENKKLIKSMRWIWPISGRVLTRFEGQKSLNKGIDIQGKLGEPVVAAADGRVVYSGSGLRGYGKLIIVKHDENFLSAYAHNRVLNVEVGAQVKAGQKIAEVGYSGATRVAKLHFEIRLNGVPVDPIQYLPKP